MSLELIKVKQIEPLDEAVANIIGDGTIPLAFCLQTTLLATGWVADGSIYKYDYTNNAINVHSIAQVIPHNDYVTVSRAAVLLPANSSYNGGLNIYATHIPSGDIGVNINIFGDGVEPQPPAEVPTKLSQLEKDIDFDERYYTENEINLLLDNKVTVPTQAEWDNFRLTIQG